MALQSFSRESYGRNLEAFNSIGETNSIICLCYTNFHPVTFTNEDNYFSKRWRQVNIYHRSFVIDGVQNAYKLYRFDRSATSSSMTWSWCMMKIYHEANGHSEEFSSYCPIVKIA